MAATAETFPGTIGEDTGVGAVSWVDGSNALTDNGAYATRTRAIPGTVTTYYMTATNFGFAVPVGATIDGVVVKVYKYMAGNSVIDANAKLVVNGSVTGNDKAKGSWQGSEVASEYGASNDVWGCTLTAALINQSNFGFAIAATLEFTDAATTAYIDAISATIYYTAAGRRRSISGYAMQKCSRY